MSARLDYPPELEEAVKIARAKKKTKKEIVEWLKPFLEVVSAKCGCRVPEINEELLGSPPYNTFEFEYKKHELKLYADFRMQGDEVTYMWERGVPWRGGSSILGQ